LEPGYRALEQAHWGLTKATMDLDAEYFYGIECNFAPFAFRSNPLKPFWDSETIVGGNEDNCHVRLRVPLLLSE
jgi:hypothetical protein